MQLMGWYTLNRLMQLAIIFPRKRERQQADLQEKKDVASISYHVNCFIRTWKNRWKCKIRVSIMISEVTWLLHSGQASHSLISCPDYFSSVSVGDNYRIRSIRPCGISSRNFVRLLFTNRERRLFKKSPFSWDRRQRNPLPQRKWSGCRR